MCPLESNGGQKNKKRQIQTLVPFVFANLSVDMYLR